MTWFESGTALLGATTWRSRPPSRRGPRPSLTMEDIARAGIELADDGGLERVSMQRVSERLGLTKMALYRYVEGRSELLALMTDAAMGTPTTAVAAGSTWRERTTEWARAMQDMLRARPWVLSTTVGARAFGPNELGWMEEGLSALSGSGLAPWELMDTLFLISGHVRNTVAVMSADDPSPRAEGADMEATTSEQMTGLEEHYPLLTRTLASPRPSEDGFSFGLSRILDGLEAFVSQRTAT